MTLSAGVSKYRRWMDGWFGGVFFFFIKTEKGLFLKPKLILSQISPYVSVDGGPSDNFLIHTAILGFHRGNEFHQLEVYYYQSLLPKILRTHHVLDVLEMGGIPAL